MMPTPLGFSVADQASLLLATSTGLFQSADGGASWRAMPLPGELPVYAVGTLTVMDEPVLLAGVADGVLRSADHGVTWQATLESSAVTAMVTAITPENHPLVLAGTAEDGVFRSADAGATWEAASPGLLDLEITSLAVSPAFPRDPTILAGTASGVFRSRNGGKAWRPLLLPDADDAALVVQCVAVQPGEMPEDSTLWAGGEAAGLWFSQDDGATWQLDTGHDAGTDVTALAVMTGTPGLVFAATQNGLFRRGADAWQRVHDAGDILCLACLEWNGRDVLLAGSDGYGILRSLYHGHSWEIARRD